ncbi:MAG TPA: hypothetical protein VF168_07165 [Trueperaceae bacterium]
MSKLRIATLGLVALLLSALLAACTQTGSDGLQPGATEGTFALDVIVEGTGIVTIEELDFQCVNDCTARIGEGVTIELQAQASGVQGFAGWHGDCSGTGSCSLTMDGDKTVTAVFADNVLVLDMQGDGQASVRLEPGEDCAGDCVRAYDTPVQVSLLVNPADDSVAAGFGGACADSERDDFCIVTVQGQVDVSATVNLRRFTLSVDRTGSGSVSGPGIECPNDCSVDVTMGESVTLTADPASGWDFERWDGGSCGTNSTCTVQMNEDQEVTAVFRQRFLLATTVVGQGTVTSSPGGIDCGPDETCEATFSAGTPVTLTPNEASGWEFVGWSSPCADVVNCKITLTEDRSVTATFEKQVVEHNLGLTIAGKGSGSVHIDPVDETCNSDCTEPIDEGQTITLTAHEDQGSTFTGWTGDNCNGQNNTCTFVMNGPANETATFEPVPVTQHNLDLTIAGQGSGSIHIDPVDETCNSDCTVPIDEGQTITLTANEDQGSTFTGWTGDNCSGTENPCSFRMNEPAEITATFSPLMARFNLTLDVSGPGTLAYQPPAGSSCTDSCTESYDDGDRVTLTAQPDDTTTTFAWGGDCSGAGDSNACEVDMTANRSVSITFTAARDEGAGGMEVGTGSSSPG